MFINAKIIITQGRIALHILNKQIFENLKLIMVKKIYSYILYKYI